MVPKRKKLNLMLVTVGRPKEIIRPSLDLILRCKYWIQHTSGLHFQTSVYSKTNS